MITKGAPPRVGEIARLLAATPRPIVINGVPTSPVLLRTYLATLSECVAANGCVYCRRALEQLWRDVEPR